MTFTLEVDHIQKQGDFSGNTETVSKKTGLTAFLCRYKTCVPG